MKPAAAMLTVRRLLRPGVLKGQRGGLVNTQLVGSVSDPVGLTWGLKICISSKFPDAAAHLGAML